MTTLNQYFAGKPHTEEQETAAIDLLDRVDRLCAEAVADNDSQFDNPNCPNTGTPISGSKGVSGDGGFRLDTATTGAGHSSHKEAKAVDVYDPHNRLDDWLGNFDNLSNGHNSKLEEYGLYREAPDATPTWCHLTTRAPGSGRRTFKP